MTQSSVALLIGVGSLSSWKVNLNPGLKFWQTGTDNSVFGTIHLALTHAPADKMPLHNIIFTVGMSSL